MTKGLAHIALYVKDFDSAVRFWRDAFGAEMIGEFDADGKACWMDVCGVILEIFEGDVDCDGYFKHIALACDDVDALYAKALSCGASELTAPKDITIMLDTPVDARIAFVRGTNGEQIELFDQK